MSLRSGSPQQACAGSAIGAAVCAQDGSGSAAMGSGCYCTVTCRCWHCKGLISLCALSMVRNLSGAHVPRRFGTFCSSIPSTSVRHHLPSGITSGCPACSLRVTCIHWYKHVCADTAQLARALTRSLRLPPLVQHPLLCPHKHKELLHCGTATWRIPAAQAHIHFCAHMVRCNTAGTEGGAVSGRT
jgi:hypothetical protein